METSLVEVRSILTRAGGFLRTVCSHSLQPYRGCPFGRSLCGAGCYVQHMHYVTRGRAWGSFLEVRSNAAQCYREQAPREGAWARRSRGRFSIFLSSATEPFPPAERKYGVTRGVLEAMLEGPPDDLILQTHSADVARHADLLVALSGRCRLRVHVSVECDRDRVPGLPPAAVPVQQRLDAARQLKERGLFVVVTVSPLLPISEPEEFFRRVAECANAAVIDHYIEGDGTPDGSRTARTPVPAAMAALEPASVSLEYRDRMVEVARRFLPAGVNIAGFAGRYGSA
ncbi:MAG: hypothetical protein AB1758_08170 [Candidatus Eremiobacterota bacterium]